MRVAFFAVLVLVGTANAQDNLAAMDVAPMTTNVAPVAKYPDPEATNAEPATASPDAAISSIAPVANAIVVTPNVVPDAPSARKFWTLENKINFSIFAAELAGDAITTQRGLNRGMREANPLARPFVTHGAGGQAAASALGFGLGVGTAYLLHRTHHYKAERIAIRIMLAAEGVAVGQNIAVLR